MSESILKDPASGKSPVVDKVAVASKHPGVFMETSEFEAETGTKVDLQIKKTDIFNDTHSSGALSNQEDKEDHTDLPVETNLPRKKVHSRSKRKRFDRTKVTGNIQKI